MSSNGTLIHNGPVEFVFKHIVKHHAYQAQMVDFVKPKFGNLCSEFNKCIYHVSQLYFLPGKDYQGLVLGHEICGEVIGIGNKAYSDGASLRLGDVVIVFPFVGCRNCEACNAGFSSLCEENRSGTTDIGQGRLTGGYGSLVVVPEWKYAVRLPPMIPPEIGCMLPCSVLTTYNAVLKARPVLEKAVRMRGVANLLVIGAGGLGFWTIVLVKSIFCDRNTQIIVADLHQEKLNEATRLGADDAIRWEPDTGVEDLVNQTTMGGYNKIDAALDFVGQPKTSEVAIKSLHKGGSLISVGLYGGQIKVSIPEIISNSISIQGNRVGDLATLKELVDLFSVQEIDKSSLPAIDVYRLEDVNEAHAKLRKGEILARAVIKHTGDKR